MKFAPKHSSHTTWTNTFIYLSSPASRPFNFERSTEECSFASANGLRRHTVQYNHRSMQDFLVCGSPSRSACFRIDVVGGSSNIVNIRRITFGSGYCRDACLPLADGNSTILGIQTYGNQLTLQTFLQFGDLPMQPSITANKPQYILPPARESPKLRIVSESPV
jgi:hypothetical protein